MSKKYPCNINGKFFRCEFGGTKRYNFGFIQGASYYCRKVKSWCHDLKKCPLGSEAVDKKDQ